MTPLLISTGVVALAEIGDKTQLLALVLAGRFRRPWPIVIGILLATLANHGLAGLAGAWSAQLLDGPWLRWIVAASFLGVGIWALIPDRFDDDGKDGDAPRYGAFLTTLVAFFLVEIGDKTQIATVALGARFQADVVSVVIGTTIGMMLANTPAVWLGEKMAHRLPLKPIRIAAAGVFVVLGLLALTGIGTR